MMIFALVKDGRLTVISEIILIGFVLIGFLGIPLFGMPLWLAVPVGLASVISAGLLIFEGAAASIGLKPFTNDPLGWRKAKKSYLSDEAAKESSTEKPSDQP
jgi:hypothetical protein